MYRMEVRKVLRSSSSLVYRVEESSALELGRCWFLVSREARVPCIMCWAGAGRAQTSLGLTEGRVTCDNTREVACAKSRLKDVLVTGRTNPQHEATAGLDRVALHSSGSIDRCQDIDGGTAI